MGLQWWSMAGGYLSSRVTQQENENINLFLGAGAMQEHDGWEMH
jgi:hypothetical protein